MAPSQSRHQTVSSSSRDVRRFKDVRKEFERSSECLEGAQARNAQAPRGKQHEVEEASNALLNARRAFRSEALDYVLEVRHDAAGSESYLTLCCHGLRTNTRLPKQSLAVVCGNGLALARLPGPVGCGSQRFLWLWKR